jgi:hypothetical protein
MSTPFLESLRVTFPGFTSAHASSLYEEGLREAADFAHVSAADVKVAAQASGGAMQIVLAGKIKAAAEAAATSNDGRAAKAAALRTHVGNLASRDPDVVSAAVDALSILGVTHLPVGAIHGTRFEVVADVALELHDVSAGERHAAISAGVYRGLALRSLESFRPRAYLPRSPISGELLQAGKDWRTGVPWGQLSPAQLGLARWMKLNDMTGGLPDAVLFIDVKDNGPTSANADDVRRARGVSDDALAALADGTMSSPSAPPKVPAKHPGSSGLRGLLLNCFSADEIRRLVGFLPQGSVLVAELPGPTASHAATTDAVVDVLRRHGAADDAFWSAVHAARPYRRDEIERVRRGG